MSGDISRVLATGAAATALAAVFLFGERIHPLRALTRNRRSLLSISAGVSLAYVFVRLLPELADARLTFASSTILPARFEGIAVYVLGLLGFIVFYGLEHFTKRARLALAESDVPDPRLRILGFSAYACLIAYLVVDSLDNSVGGLAAYTVAMGVHFLTVDHRFREEPGETYRRRGHLLLAMAVLVGWGMGLLFALPRDILALMIGFLSGGVIINSMISELPSGERQTFVPFAAGGLLYSMVLIPLN